MKWFKNLWPSLLLITLVPYMMGTTYSTVGIFSSVEVSGIAFINETTNANMDNGLTINIGTSTKQALTFKDSNVAHGGVSLQMNHETDDFAGLQKASANGGLIIESIDDSTTNDTALLLSGVTLDADVDTVDTLTRSTIEIHATQHDSAGALANMEAGAAVFSVQARIGGAARTLLVVDEDGDLFADGSAATVFDSHNDFQLVSDLEWFRTVGLLELDYTTMQANESYNRLWAAGIIGDIGEESWNSGARPLINRTRQLHLFSGNMRQNHGRVQALLDVMEEDPQFRAKMRAAMAARGLSHIARPELP